jgi:hypothetical protein
MSRQIVLIDERLFALGAGKISLVRVYFQMHQKRPIRSELLATNLTFIFFLAVVDLQMRLQVVLMVETFGTKHTFEPF